MKELLTFKHKGVYYIRMYTPANNGQLFLDFGYDRKNWQRSIKTIKNGTGKYKIIKIPTIRT